MYSCLMVLVPAPCQLCSYGLSAGVPLSLLPDLGFSHGLLVAAWDRAALPCRQAGSEEQGRLPSEMISIHPRVSSLSTLMEELMKQMEGGGISP